MIPSNYVLVKPDENFKEVHGLQVADGFEPAKHLSITGTVLEVPRCLNFYGKEVRKHQKVGKTPPLSLSYIQKLVRNSLDWHTEMEIAVGDKVHFRYTAHLECYEEDLVVEVNGEDCYLIRYDSLYLANDSKLLNGWILVEPIEWKEDELVSEEGVIRPKPKGGKVGMGVVRLQGSMNKGYLHYDLMDMPIENGATIYFRHSRALSIDYKYHSTFKYGNCYRMQRKDILFIK